MAPTTGRSVLFVDGVEDQREMYSAYFRRREWRVWQASEGAAALQAVAEHRPDIVITELVLPGAVDGLAVVRAIKSAVTTREVPVVILTAYVFPADRSAAEEAGCDAFVAKPCIPSALLAEVRLLLAKARLLARGATIKPRSLKAELASRRRRRE